jgi:DNA polymerase (family 10)
VLASIRGDIEEGALLSRAAEVMSARRIATERDLARFITSLSTDDRLQERLRQILEAGVSTLLESRLADLPADLRWLYESGAVSLKELGTIHARLRLSSAAEIADALERELVGPASGVAAGVAIKIAAVLPTLRTPERRLPLGRAVAIAEPVMSALHEVPGVTSVFHAGSLRRGEDTVGDIELIAAVQHPHAAIDHVLVKLSDARCLHRSERRVYVRVDRAQVGVRFAEPANVGSELVYFTGSRRHVEALRRLAATKGFRLTVEGLTDAAGRHHPAASEDEFYARLGLPFIAPEIRDGDDELSAAAAASIPRLLSVGDIRGDLHMHTVWSDGRDTTEAMVRTCETLGYEYVAITDHSQSSAASRNLNTDDVSRQADEIEALRERYSRLTILHGCEVDILPNGQLDFPDRILERFDIVLASLHDRAAHSPDRLMERYVGAMKHPLVAMITHPTNRMVPHRSGYELDYDHLFEAAASTGTFLEVDGSPAHLDLDGALARRAAATGVTLAVDSDCHSADLLARQMNLGVVVARRGWVEPRHVLNTRPISAVRAAIQNKRAGR